MGYLFLIIALLSGAAKGFCGKKISGEVVSLKGVFFINFIRMAICVAIGFFIVFFDGINKIIVNTEILLITAVSGISTAMFVFTWILCVRRGAYVMVDVSIMLGAIVPIVLCNLFFGESITIYRCVGFLLLLWGSYIMCSYSSNIKGSFSLASFAILLVCGMCNGITDFSQKWFIHIVETGSVAVFNFYTYIFSAVSLLILFAITDKIEKTENDGKSTRVFWVICIMAACLFANSYFKTMAAKYIDSSILYPLSNGASLIIAATMASLFFGERITKKCLAGIGVTLSAMIVMNL